ncbi:MAG: hypothetical protein PUI31_06085 [Clostridia bacterium]|nr:hypothetical protein [Clostridia bacterium]
MKKFLGKAFCLAMACALLCGAIACSPKTPEETGESTTGGNGLIETGVAAEYLPQLSEIKKYSGTINVDMIFGKHEYGWKAVKQAYQALQPGVNVKLTNYGSEDLSESSLP